MNLLKLIEECPSELYSADQMDTVMQVAKRFACSTGISEEYFTELACLYTQLFEPSKNLESDLTNYLFLGMQFDDNPIVRGKGKLMEGQWENVADLVIHSNGRKMYAVPMDLAAHFDIRNASDAYNKLQSEPAGTVESGEELYVCLERRLRNPDEKVLSNAPDVGVMPCDTKANAFDGGYRDDPFESSHTDHKL